MSFDALDRFAKVYFILANHVSTKSDGIREYKIRFKKDLKKIKSLYANLSSDEN